MLDYFLKANLYGLLFVSCYWLLLRRHTFFSLNRAYLLLSAVLTLGLPLASLPVRTAETLPVPVGVIVLPVSRVIATPTEARPDWEAIGLIVYGLITFVLVARLLSRVWQLLLLIRHSPQRVCPDHVLIQTTHQQDTTFSFFRYLILSPADTHNDLIIRHELVHIRQHHSVDVMGLALLQAIFWPCPALWLIDQMLRQVHEFLADKAVNQPKVYAQLLVDYALGSRPNALTNNFFNPSLLKQRIVMLHQKTTTRWALGKYILIVPFSLGLLAMTTAREEIQAMVDQTTDRSITVSGQVKNRTGKALAGANLVIANTGKGTSTDVNGKFTLSNVPKSASLAVSFVGFTLAVIPVKGQKNLTVILQPADPTELPTMGATAAYKAVKPNPTISVGTPSSQTVNGEVFTSVEEPAVFPTGIPGVMQYVSHTLRYPAKARLAGIEGNVLVQFVVMPTGSIGSAKIKKGIGGGCDEEALRVVRQMPKWIPGKQNGKAVSTQYIIPIQFALEKTEDKRTGQVLPPNQAKSEKREGYATVNNPDDQSALRNNEKRTAFIRAASQPINRFDSSKKVPTPLRLVSPQQPDNHSLNRYGIPYQGPAIFTVRQQGVPGEPAELFLVEGTKQINRMDDIRPEDIESIEVDKGEATMAKYKVLYGSIANKGVVTIHLKSNKSV